MRRSETAAHEASMQPIAVELIAMLVAVADGRPLAMTIEDGGALPSEPFEVRAGGGSNHRFGLDDAVLIKDNHVGVAGSVVEAIRRARAYVGALGQGRGRGRHARSAQRRARRGR
jgi:hypothetical protein